MRLLAVDTSGKSALWMGVENGRPVDAQSVEVGRKHDEVLGEGVASWLTKHGREWPEAIAVVVGPGGFTGLRVGVAFASGLAETLGLKLLPVSTYETLAASVNEPLVWTVPVATSREIRTRLMRGGEQPEPLGEPVAFPAERVELPPGDAPLVALGEGFLRSEELLRGALGERLREPARVLPQQEALARAVAHAVATRELTTPGEVDVDYGAEFHPTPKAVG